MTNPELHKIYAVNDPVTINGGTYNGCEATIKSIGENGVYKVEIKKEGGGTATEYYNESQLS